MTTEIKNAEEKYLKKIIDLHNINLKDDRKVSDWKWEYKDNYPNSSVFKIIIDNEDVIGTQGMIPIYLNVNGETILSGKSENSLINKKYRGSTLFTDLYFSALKESEEKGMSFIWGFTPAYKVWRYKLGFKDYSDLMFGSLLVLKPINYIKSFLKTKNSLKYKLLIILSTLPLYLYSSINRHLVYLTKKHKDDYLIKTKYNNISDIQELFQRLSNKYINLIYLQQTDNYLKWRIENNPNLRYETYYLYQNNILKAYCYLAITNKNTSYLSDFTFEDETYGMELLNYLIDKNKNKNCIYFLIGNISNPLIINIKKILEKFGFISKKNNSSIVIKNLNYQNEKILYEIKNWYINDLWTEGFERDI